MISRDYFVDESWCKKHLVNKKVFIFGAGVDGEKACKKLDGFIFIESFIDNKRFGGLFCNKEIISIDEYKKIRSEDTIIILAAYRYAPEMIKQLLNENFTAGKDFIVWDDMHILQPDDICDRYVDFMKNIWEEKKIDSDNQVLLAYDNRHDADTVIYAYCANYLAEKYQASIMGFCRYGAKPCNASKVLLDIYKSLNMKDVIDPTLSEELRKEADRIFDEVWDVLFTWEDWKNITIYHINFGTTIITDYLREKIPSFDLRADEVARFIRESVDTIVFWYHYITEHNIKAVVLADAVCWEGYIRDIAVTLNIPTYAVQYTMQRAYLNFHDRTDAFLNYKNMWQQLSEEEKKKGIEWAKEHINNRVRGSLNDLDAYTAMNYTFAEASRDERVLADDMRIKVVIFPHVFEENSYQCGEHIFDNSYVAWLNHLGELSEVTPQYDWYIKMHPAARRRDPIIINRFVERYPKIKLIPSNVSPLQLKREGVRYALTVCGTLGHEFPAIGIDVINAGINPHSAFDFTWNPRTKEEYDEIIFGLEKLEPKNNLNDLYIFYAMHYLYYDREYINWKDIFFNNPLLAMSKEQLEAYDKEYGTWKYEEYMKEWTMEKHRKILSEMPNIFRMMDEWDPTVFYRKVTSEERKIYESEANEDDDRRTS